MKRIILAATALVSAVALTSAARAADVVAPMGYDWSGFYFGVNAGAAWNNTDIDNDINGPLASDLLDELSNDFDGDDAVFTGGAMIGYNWQMESLVLGVEADINYLGFSGDADRDVDGFDVGGINSASHKLSFEADWYGTLRGRLGFAADNFLFYGTGGLAYGHLEAESDFRLYDDGDEVASWKGSADDINWGWTIGAGMEYGIDNWSLGVEYLFVDLGEADWDADSDNAQLDAFNSEGTVDYQFSVVRATAKIRF